MVDEVDTLIDSVKGNVARGHIVNSDFSLSKTFIAKVGGSFAHGETIEKAMSDATRKHLEDASTEERVDEFLKQFDGAADYSAEELMEGYRLLSGACEQGCLSFMKNKSIIAADRFTLTQFVDIVLGAYSPGDEAILILKKRLSD
jgi:hypothetical protein